MSSNVPIYVAATAAMLAVATTGWQQLQINALSSQVEQLRAEKPTGAVIKATQVATWTPPAADSPHARDIGGQPTRLASRGEAGDPEIGDALWSEEGQAAIDNAVGQREERRSTRRGERWRQMQQLRQTRVVDRLSESLNLSEADSEALSVLMTEYSETRSAWWRAMNADGEVDTAKIMEDADAKREQYMADLDALLGEEGAEELSQMMRGSRF